MKLFMCDVCGDTVDKDSYLVKSSFLFIDNKIKDVCGRCNKALQKICDDIKTNKDSIVYNEMVARGKEYIISVTKPKGTQ